IFLLPLYFIEVWPPDLIKTLQFSVNTSKFLISFVFNTLLTVFNFSFCFSKPNQAILPIRKQMINSPSPPINNRFIDLHFLYLFGYSILGLLKSRDKQAGSP